MLRSYKWYLPGAVKNRENIPTYGITITILHLLDHPYCNNQLGSSGVDQVGLLGQFLTSTVHTLMYTFEMAPVFTVMEANILQRLREMIGWSNGEGDGIFSPG